VDVPVNGISGLARFFWDKPVSRKGAKYAKFAKKNEHFFFALLCAFATSRELF